MSLIRMLKCPAVLWLILAPLSADETVRKDSDPANRAKRGEFKTRDEIKRVCDQVDPWLDDLTAKIPLAIKPAVNRLAQQLRQRHP